MGPSVGMTSSNAATFGFEFWRAFLCEFFATLFLVFMVFGTAVDQVNVRKGGFGSIYGAAIGGTVAMAACGIGKWIVSLMATTSEQRALHNSMGFLVYTLACLGGGVVGGITYKALFLPKD